MQRADVAAVRGDHAQAFGPDWLQALNASAKHGELSTRDGALNASVHGRRQPMPMHIPERLHMPQESPALCGTQTSPQRRRYPTQLRHHTPPFLTVLIVGAELADMSYQCGERRRQRVKHALARGRNRAVWSGQQTTTRDRRDGPRMSSMQQLYDNVNRCKAGAGEQYRRVLRDGVLLLGIPGIIDDERLGGQR